MLRGRVTADRSVDGINVDEVVDVWLFALQISLEPIVLLRAVIDDEVERHAERLPEAIDVGPVAHVGIDAAIVDHGKPVIGRIGKERQDVNRVDHRYAIRSPAGTASVLRVRPGRRRAPGRRR